MDEHRFTDPELRAALARLEAAENAVGDARRILLRLQAQAAPSAPQGPSLDHTTTPPAPQQDPLTRQDPRAPQGPPIQSGPPRQPAPAMYQTSPVRSYPGPPRPSSAPPQPASLRRPDQSDRVRLTLEQKVIRGIAVGGSLITIIGVALLIALAIQSGWLGPLGRVIGTAVFGALLLAAGFWLHTRKEASTAGVTALVTTSYLVFSLLVFALVHWLVWWPELLGAVTLVIIHVGFLGLARFLNLAWLSYAVAIFGGVLAIVSQTHHPASWVVALLPLLTLAVTFRSGWIWPRVFSGIATIVLLLTAVNISPPDESPLWNALATVSFLAFVALGISDRFPVQAADRPDSPGQSQPGAPMTAQYWQSRRQNHSAQVQPRSLTAELDRNHVLLLIPGFILLIQLVLTHSSWFVWLVPALALIMTGIGWHAHRKVESLIGLSALPASLVFLWAVEPPVGPLQPSAPAAVLGLYLLFALALVAWLSTTDRLGRLPWVVWLAGLVIMTGTWAGHATGRFPWWLTSGAAAVLAALLMLLIALCLARYRTFHIFPVWARVLGAVAILYFSTLVIVTLSTFLGQLLAASAGMWLGYLFGHAAVSGAWMILGAVVLLARTPLDNRTELGIGVLLATAATIKLVFFDLSALSGVPRVIAFLVCGVVLLVIAALRGRRSSNEETGPGPAPSPGGHSAGEAIPPATGPAQQHPASNTPPPQLD